VTAGDRRRLTKLASSRTAPYQQVIRARIVLDAACGSSDNAISRRLGVSVDTVRCWRGRYADQGLAGLADRPRSGRPPRLTPLQVAEVKALACQLPAETGVPLSRWSCPELADQVVARGIAPAISASTVRRILAADTLKPWQYRSWLFIRDPQFATKATRVLDLYARIWQGVRLREDEVVDNGSSHRGQAAIDRLTRRYPNAVMVHTPVHASWLNQVEIFFSIIQRKVLTPNDFTDLDQVQNRLAVFEHRYNQTARPFRWKFTPADLHDLLARIERHEQTEPGPQHGHQPALPTAA
jgi:transposase